jgi:hypothetical protein
MADGQLAINSNLASPGLFVKDSNGDLVKVGPVHVGATAPNVSPASGGQAGNSKGEQWLDTASSRYVFKVWDGTAWRTEDGEFVNVTGDVMTGALVMDNQQQVQFRETTANGTNYIALQATASVASDKIITLPDVTGTVVTTGDTGSITNTMVADGTITDAKLATIATAGKVSNSATTAASANTASAIVARDGSGNFSAGTITAALAGNASTVTTNANLTGDITSVGNATSIATGVIVNADINASAAIDLSKLANGALPSAVTVASVNIVNDSIVNADVNSAAAIAGTKISPDFGSQNVITTGNSTAAALIPSSATVPANGIYLPSANSVGVSTSGVARVTVSAAGAVAIPAGDLTVYGVRVGRGNGAVASNTALGSGALAANTTGANNIATGASALAANTTGNQNIATGTSALAANTTGIQNVATGTSALTANTTGSYNVATGFQALAVNTTGGSSVATGYQALLANTTGSNNVATGLQALLATTSGSTNTAIGDIAGSTNTTGSNNSFVGFNSQGASATASNVITLGNASIATLRCQVTTITSLSDARDKKEITNLRAGLDFVSKLRPVSFTWDARDQGKVDIEDAGFIAQELLAVQEETGIVIPNLVSQENPDRLEAGYSTLLPVLVNAVQELAGMVEGLQDEITALKGA